MIKRKQIKTLKALHRAYLDKKSVVVPASHAWEKHTPAAFVINLSGATLYNLFEMGMYIYK